MEKIIYFDNASTTKVYDNLYNDIDQLNNDFYFNPSALYKNALNVSNKIKLCKNQIKSILNADQNDNIIFTSCATESNNLAIRGILKKNIGKLLFSNQEHPSVYNLALQLKLEGYDVDFINTNKLGLVDFEDFKNKMTNNVGFVSIMFVCNETGAINDIKRFCEYAKDINPKCIFHSDCVQAYCKVEINVEKLGIDMLTLSSHKIHGPKGVGALFVKSGIMLKPLLYGGGQENNIRSGTENYLGIKLFTDASEIGYKNLKDNYNKVLVLKNYLVDELNKSNLKINIISNEYCSPYINAISFNKVRSETLLYLLESNSVYVSNGSACSSKKSGNRILENMGIDKGTIEGSIRISFSSFNTIEEVKTFIDIIKNEVLQYLKNINVK